MRMRTGICKRQHSPYENRARPKSLCLDRKHFVWNVPQTQAMRFEGGLLSPRRSANTITCPVQISRRSRRPSGILIPAGSARGEADHEMAHSCSCDDHRNGTVFVPRSASQPDPVGGGLPPRGQGRKGKVERVAAYSTRKATGCNIRKHEPD